MTAPERAARRGPTERPPAGATAPTGGAAPDRPAPPAPPRTQAPLVGLPRTRRCLSTLVVSLAVLWAAFLAAHLLLTGRWWVWLLVAGLPPLAFLAVPAALLAALPAVERGRRLLAGVLAVLCLFAGSGQAGLNPGALGRGDAGPVPAGSVRVVSWNTEYWDQGEDTDRFFAYLRGLHADIYLLQEYLSYTDGEVRPIDDSARLRAEFPGYRMVVKGQLVTLSRLPVLAVPAVAGTDVLRVDVTATGPVPAAFSTYNVHIPVQLDPGRNPLTPGFYRLMHRRAAERDRQYGALGDDVAANPRPALIAGDFNTSPAMGDIRRISHRARDAIRASGALYPVSWNAHSILRWWRLDWAFTTRGLGVHDYRLREPRGRSDHYAQDLVLTPPGGTR